MKIKKAKRIGRIAILFLALTLVSGDMTVYAKSRTPKVQKVQWSGVKSKFTASTGTRKTLTAKVKPAKASQKLKWSSSNKKVATVSSKGVVTFKKKGTVTITCKSKARSSKKVRCKITVKKGKAAFSSGSLSLWTGDARRMAPVNVVGKTIQYSSSNNSIASVSSNGTVRAKNPGTATITAKIKDGTVSSGSYKVNVTRRINAGDTGFIAHRGLSSQAPENSKPAFELGAQSGYWGVETDVRITKDNEFVISHDESLQRMCGVNESISNLTLAQVRKYPITQGKNHYLYAYNKDAMTIPTLKEYLTICKRYKVVPVIELKWAVKEDGNVTIRFRSPDGNTVDSVDDLSGVSGKEISNRTMPQPTRAGYSLEWYEWYDKVDADGRPVGKEAVSSLPKYFPTRNITYYAVWIAQEASISFQDENEAGIDGVDDLKGKTGEKLTSRDFPQVTKEGFHAEWYDSLSKDANKVDVLPESFVAGDVIYYLKWVEDASGEESGEAAGDAQGASLVTMETEETSEEAAEPEEPIIPQEEIEEEIPEEQVDEQEGNILTAEEVTVTKEDDQAIKDAPANAPVVVGESGNLSLLQEATDDDIQRLYNEVKSVMGNSPVVFIAFNYNVLTAMKTLKKNNGNKLNASFQYLYSGNDCGWAVNRSKEAGFGFDVSAAVCSPAQAGSYRSMGVPVNVWTIDDRNKAYSYITQGVSNITTNSKFW